MLLTRGEVRHRRGAPFACSLCTLAVFGAGAQEAWADVRGSGSCGLRDSGWRQRAYYTGRPVTRGLVTFTNPALSLHWRPRRGTSGVLIDGRGGHVGYTAVRYSHRGLARGYAVGGRHGHRIRHTYVPRVVVTRPRYYDYVTDRRVVRSRVRRAISRYLGFGHRSRSIHGAVRTRGAGLGLRMRGSHHLHGRRHRGPGLTLRRRR